MPDNQAAEKYQIIEALGAELRKVPAVPYSNPNQYQKVAGRLAAELPERDLGQSVRQYRQSRRALRIHRAGDLARHRRQDRRLLRRDRHRRHAGGRRRLPEVEVPVGAHRAGRSAGQRALSLLQGRRAQVRRRLVDHRGHRHRARHRQPRRRADRRCDPHLRMPRPCASSTGCCARRACCSAARPGINVAAAVAIAQADRAGTHHRHRAVRRRREVSVAAVQSRLDQGARVRRGDRLASDRLGAARLGVGRRGSSPNQASAACSAATSPTIRSAGDSMRRGRGLRADASPASQRRPAGRPSCPARSVPAGRSGRGAVLQQPRDDVFESREAHVEHRGGLAAARARAQSGSLPASLGMAGDEDSRCGHGRDG